MTEAQSAALRLAGMLLSYPQPEFLAQIPQLEDTLHALMAEETAGPFAQSALSYLQLLQTLPAAEIAQRHVAFFDHTPAASLYMTWHRYGNDRSQGKAMAALNGLYRTAGFEPLEGEMPDYLPRMLEFLAIAPDWACEALLDGFGAEISALLLKLKDLGAEQAEFLEQALVPLRSQYPALFEPRKGPDPTRRPMAQPEPEPQEPLIPLQTPENDI